ncbi:MAG: LPS export ABC transporter periplasmic protein LptC [Gammaproteobacteria bacterium]|nr:LPS export ABC transporter periplasmic protein LptC [Gammaproteobacteria bacterium]MDH5692592.1 LPS export ABC transporter periplasmic protein LptC [Gammaproteobacteria bacterium]
MIVLFNQPVRVRFIVLLFGVLILVAFIPEADKTMREQTGALGLGVDYYMERFYLVETDHTGAPLRSLGAANMSHFPNDTVHMTEPHYRLIKTKREDKQWEIRSSFGIITERTNVLLSGNVTINRLHAQEKSSKSTLLQVKSEDLHIDLTKNQGETDNPVTVSNPSGTVSAIGMRINFDDQRLQLHSQVKGVYKNPNPSDPG